MAALQVALLLLLTSGCLARYYFEELGYLKLPFSTRPRAVFRMQSGTVEEGAYDPVGEILYVVGEGSNMLYVVDLANPRNPGLVFTHEFHHADGVARDVEVCQGRVAVALSSDIDVFPGHVQFFKSYDRGTGLLEYEGRATVGEFPDNLKFTEDCKTLLVANEGKSGVDHTQAHVNPPGTLTIISFPTTGNPTEREVDFKNFNDRTDVRKMNDFIPPSVNPDRATLDEELEPEYITVVDRNYAYVTFQENHAIGRIRISTGQADLLKALDLKDWRNFQIDASDKDGGIHMASYGIKSLRQPDTIKSLVKNGQTYLFVADEGFITYFRDSTHGFHWNEAARADSLMLAQRFDRDAINNDTLYAELGQDTKLGRLFISELDGQNLFTGRIGDVHTFGGRGFSVYNATSSDISLVYDSGDELERRAASSYPHVFNSDVAPGIESPETLRDTTSDDMGPKPNALDVAEDGNAVFLVVGSETTGVIYLYTVDTSGQFGVNFEDVHRRGRTDFLWNQLYEMGEAGDAYICDMGIIKKSDHSLKQTMVYVLGAASGSVSIYRIAETSNDV